MHTARQFANLLLTAVGLPAIPAILLACAEESGKALAWNGEAS
jgi:hypothetical protein